MPAIHEDDAQKFLYKLFAGLKKLFNVTAFLAHDVLVNFRDPILQRALEGVGLMMKR
ncbi:MAG: hypothetical protein ACXWNK_15585 [Vulcanimicrobiaceae bacterium]